MNHQQEAINILRRAGELEDNSIDLAETALALAAADMPRAEFTPYRDHLASLRDQLSAQGNPYRLDDRLRILRRVLVVQHKYHGDEDNYDNLHNANLMKVIDRRCGLPVALGIIYLHVAEAMGWPMTGLNFPGHFFVSLAAPDGRAILDPFRAGQTCQATDLHEFLPANRAEIDEEEDDDGVFNPDYYAPVSKRDVLLRLQNNIKLRHLQHDRLDQAIGTLQTMILIAPKRFELWRELSFLHAERGNMHSAITALEVVADLAGDVENLQQVETMLEQLKWRLN